MIQVNYGIGLITTNFQVPITPISTLTFIGLEKKKIAEGFHGNKFEQVLARRLSKVIERMSVIRIGYKVAHSCFIS